MEKMGFNQIKLLLSLENPITVYILFHDIDIQYIYIDIIKIF